MVLPLLFSFLAPQLLGAGGALAGLGLSGLGTAGLSALGAGLGGTIESGGDLEKGLMTGLGAFAGGQLLGPVLGGASGGAGAASGAGGTVKSILPEIQSASTAGAAGAGAAGAMPAIKDLASGFGKFAMSPQGMATGIGSMAGSALGDAMFSKGEDKPKSKYGKYANTEMKPIPRMATMPGADYKPGTSGEWNYGISTPQSAEDLIKYNTGVYPYASGGMLSRMARPNIPGVGPVRLAGGGIVALADGGEVPNQPNEREIISAAIAAVKGEHPRPEIALAVFVQNFGEDALRTLVDKVEGGEMEDTAERFASGENGEVRGPGDGSGVDDMVPAKMDDGSGDVLLSDGEFVMRKDATDSLENKFGGGFLNAVNDAGAKAGDVAQRKMAAA